MFSRFPIAIALALSAVSWHDVNRAAAAPPADATHKTTTVAEFMAGEQDAKMRATPASLDHAPVVYVIVKANRAGDSACRIECSPDATVGSVISKAAYPHPINFASARIAVHRARHHVNDDLTVEAEEETLPVEWNANANQPTEKTDHRLQPGDRVILTLPKSADDVFAPTPSSAGPYYTDVASISPEPAFAATPQPTTQDAPRAVRYSAIPAAVPSPFSAGQPVAVAPHAAIAAPVPTAESTSAGSSSTRFEVVVVEDLNNSFAEFEQLQTRMPFMLAETSMIRGTLRILEKHDLVKRLAVPKITVPAGETGTVAMGAESTAGDSTTQELQMDFSSRELGGGLVIEFAFKRTDGHQKNEVQTSLIVPHGQSVVMKTGQSPTSAADENATDDKASHAVYVVLTPEIVK